MLEELCIFSHRKKLERSLNKSDEGLKSGTLYWKHSLSDIPNFCALLDLSIDGRRYLTEVHIVEHVLNVFISGE